jgi:hypothetical protein
VKYTSLLSNTDILLVEGNLKEGGKAVKPLVIINYTTHLVYADLYDKMANSYSIREPRNGPPPPPKKTFLPFVRPYHSEFIHKVQVLWRFKSPMFIKLIHKLPC